MSTAGRGVDALGLLLTGGAANSDPDASLGGVPSAKRVRGLGAFVDLPGIPALRLDDAYPANGAGVGTLRVDGVGALSWAPPGSSPGASSALPAGGRVVLAGADPDRAVLVYREAGLRYPANTQVTFELELIMNGPIAGRDLSDHDRVAGLTTYRAVALQALGPKPVVHVRLWLPPVGGSQATWDLGLETPSGGALQVVPDEVTTPAGVVFSSPTTEGAALVAPVVAVGGFVGLWIRKTWPADGSMTVRETVKLAVKFKVAS